MQTIKGLNQKTVKQKQITKKLQNESIQGGEVLCLRPLRTRRVHYAYAGGTQLSGLVKLMPHRWVRVQVRLVGGHLVISLAQSGPRDRVRAHSYARAHTVTHRTAQSPHNEFFLRAATHSTVAAAGRRWSRQVWPEQSQEQHLWWRSLLQAAPSCGKGEVVET